MTRPAPADDRRPTKRGRMETNDTSRPVRAVLTCTVRPEDTAAFEQAWASAAAWIQHRPGCLRQTLCRSGGTASEPAPTYVIASDWADAATFHAFEKSPEQDDATAPIRRLRQSARMELTTIVDHRG
jgi:heme-degrading monooxygenase HmoA